MGLFDERVAYKPFEYPQYYTDGWLPQAQAFWLHTEISMQGDVKDFKENLPPAERNLVGNILLGFAQTETAVGDYWTSMVTKWLPKHEIKQMAMMFGSQETIHAAAYSYLINTKAGYDHNVMKISPKARQDVARSIAVFSAFAEGVALYSSFAVLYSFQMRNLLKGIGQQMKWSVRDESLHSKMGCVLFNHLCEENPGVRDSVRTQVEEAARIAVEMEMNFIDKMFEMGDLENLKADDLKEFIKKRANEKLQELGYDGIFDYDKEKAAELDWFYHLTGGHTHTDFFSVRPTDYSKANEGEDFEAIWD